MSKAIHSLYPEDFVTYVGGKAEAAWKQVGSAPPQFLWAPQHPVTVGDGAWEKEPADSDCPATP